MSDCAYLHAYFEDDWGKCPPDSGPVRRYKFVVSGGIRWYCDAAAQQVRDEGLELVLADEVGGDL